MTNSVVELIGYFYSSCLPIRPVDLFRNGNMNYQFDFPDIWFQAFVAGPAIDPVVILANQKPEGNHIRINQACCPALVSVNSMRFPKCIDFLINQ